MVGDDRIGRFVRTLGLHLLVIVLFTPASPYSQNLLDQDIRSHRAGNGQSRAVEGWNVELIGQWPSDPSDPTDLFIYSMDVLGSHAYLAVRLNGEYGLQVIDMSAPEHPFERGFVRSTFWNVVGGLKAFESATAQPPGLYAYLGSDIINLSLPDFPMIVGVLEGGRVTSEVEVVGDIAYLGRTYGGERQLRVLDISDPVEPSVMGTFALSPFDGPLREEELINILVVGDFAYTNWYGSSGHYSAELFRVIDVSDPTNPFEVANVHEAVQYDLGCDPCLPLLTARAVLDGFLYVGTSAYDPAYEGIWIYDIADPANTERTATYEVPDGRAGEIVVAGNHAFVAAGSAGLSVLDVSDPISPAEVGYYNTARFSWNVALAGSNVVLTDGAALYILRFVVPAIVNLMPKTLNLDSKGRWIHAYIKLPPANDVRDIDVSSILLNDAVPAEQDASWSQASGRAHDGGPENISTVKFSRQAVADILPERKQVEVKVNGRVGNAYFEGFDAIRVIRFGGLSAIEAKQAEIPSHIALHQNYPNPFNPTTTISLTLPGQTHVNLSIFDVRGKIVKTLIDEIVAEGSKEIHWDGKDAHGSFMGSGVYLYRLVAGENVLVRRMVLLR